MIGGVTVNVILGVLIYWGILFVYGESYLPTKNVKYGIMVDSLAMEMGLRNGDKILTLDGKEVEDFAQDSDGNCARRREGDDRGTRWAER
jgi:regulator of sigma E protease